MVFFTCGLSGENIKLPKVAKYLQRCPTNELTCIGTLKKWISKKGQQSLGKVVHKCATSMGQFENRSIFDNCKKIFKTEWDCNVTFTRETYSSHKSCVTENQRYGGKDYVEKGAKGETKKIGCLRSRKRCKMLICLKELKEFGQGILYFRSFYFLKFFFVFFFFFQ